MPGIAFFLSVILLGMIQGLTEWLPVSSTGHLLLVEELVPLGWDGGFRDLFLVVVQLGSVLAVLTRAWHSLVPRPGAGFRADAKEKLPLLMKIAAASLPVAVVGFLFEDFIERRVWGDRTTALFVIAGALIAVGVVFLLLERRGGGRGVRVETLSELSLRDAFLIGCFQVFALIPGTSRSGATVCGALALGVGRECACSFSFLVAIPVMFGASALKTVKYALEGNALTAPEVTALVLGAAVAYFVSLAVIGFLTDFVKRHTFRPFAVYRILLGALLVAVGISRAFA